MKRVMINLIKNSLAAIENEGKIRIRTSYNPTLQTILLEVSDDGCGILKKTKGDYSNLISLPRKLERDWD